MRLLIPWGFTTTALLLLPPLHHYHLIPWGFTTTALLLLPPLHHYHHQIVMTQGISCYE